MLQLRAYQQQAKDEVIEAWQRVRSVLAVIPTGGGKTCTFASIIHDHLGASATIVHRKEILAQISLALGQLEVKHRVIAPEKTVRMIRRKHLKQLGRSYVDTQALAGVVSVQTLTSKSTANNRLTQAWLTQVTLAVFDESHHFSNKGHWARAVEGFGPTCKMLHVTASPGRADGIGLGVPDLGGNGYVEEMVVGPTTRWLIDEGYLSRYKYKAPSSDLDVEDLATTASGDFNVKALRQRVVESHLVGDVVEHYRKHAGGKRAIVFSTDVATAEDQAEAFREAGYTAVALSGETDDAVREAALADFEAGRTQILVNVDLFDEGFDVPAVECVVLARPTQSLGKYLQMVGRSLRPIYAAGSDLSTAEGRHAAMAAGNKPFATIIDPVRNWERHGMPCWPRAWTLASRDKRERQRDDDGTIPQKVCTFCTQPFEAFYRACPHCGCVPEPAGRAAPEQVEGDLTDLDVDALAALFNKIQQADMPDEEYRRQQAARGIPLIGRNADLKRHQAARHRRHVLRELVAWWMGLQPAERELGEKHRRFYHRFGTDVATAETLNAKDTDALIERIGAHFTRDLEDMT